MEYSFNIPQKKYDFLTLVGPLALFSSLLLFLIKKPSSDLLLPFVALSGMVLCWLKRTTGLIISLCLLAAIECYLFKTIPFSQGIWQLIMGCSLALAFTTIAISREDRLSVETESVEKLISDLKKQLEAEQETVATLKISLNELETASQSHAQLQQEYDSFKKEHHRMRVDFQDAKVKLEEAFLIEKKTIANLIQENEESKNSLLTEKQLRKEDRNEAEKKELHAQKIINDLKETITQLTKETVFLEGKVNQLGKNIEALQKENATLQSQKKALEKFEESNSELQTLLIQRDRNLEQLSEKIEVIESEKNTQSSLVNKLSLDLEASHFEKENALSEINALKAKQLELIVERQHLNSEIEKNRLILLEAEQARIKSDAESIEFERLARRFEGMYKQLVLQFKEKSEILNETRFQLFHSEEKLMQLQKEWEDSKIFTPSQEERLLQKHILSMEKYYCEKEKEHQLEIDQLTDLISHLSQRNT